VEVKMKFWLSHTGSVVYILIEDPKRKGYIEANLISLKKLWRERRHKRINLKSLTQMYSLPRECFRFNHFPIGYNRDWFFERPSIYFHEIKKIHDKALDL
jgi:hypothetical protein